MDTLRTHPLARLAETLGEIAIVWNVLHFFLFIVFWRLNNNDVASSRALFFSLRSDRDRRDMVAALAERVLQPWPTMKRHVVTAVTAVGSLERRRSDLVQVLWAFQSQAQHASDLADRPRLSEADLARELDGLLQAVVDMTRTIIQVSRELEDYLAPADNPLQLKRL